MNKKENLKNEEIIDFLFNFASLIRYISSNNP